MTTMTKPKTIRRLAVFCGANTGTSSVFSSVGKELGAAIVNCGWELIFGGGKVGLMGVVANAALEKGGKVTGVIPEALRLKEVAHEGVTELIVVKSMHERKQRMSDLADGFIALPGGYGTLDEFFEILTWAQLGFHQKPCGLLNVDGFFDSLLEFLDGATRSGFIRQEHRKAILTATSVGELFEAFGNFRPVVRPKWIGENER